MSLRKLRAAAEKPAEQVVTLVKPEPYVYSPTELEMMQWSTPVTSANIKSASEHLGRLKTMRTKIAATFATMKKPLNALRSAILDLEKSALGPVQAAEDRLGAEIGRVRRVMQDEADRLARARLEAAAAEERARLDALAAEAEAEADEMVDPLEALSKRETAEQLRQLPAVVEVAPAEIVETPGISWSESWTGRVDNVEDVVCAIADRVRKGERNLLAGVTINQVFWNDMARQVRKEGEIFPGVTGVKVDIDRKRA